MIFKKVIPILFILCCLTISPAAATGSPPVANFTGEPTSGTYPLTVNFTDSSTNSPTSWYWEFGDNSNSTLQNPSHEYSDIGVYTVNLTATNGDGSNTTTKTEYITVTPSHYWTMYVDSSTDYSMGPLGSYDDGSGDAIYDTAMLGYGELGPNCGLVRYDFSLGDWVVVESSYGNWADLTIFDNGTGEALYVVSDSSFDLMRYTSETSFEIYPSSITSDSYHGGPQNLVVYDDGTGDGLYVGSCTNNDYNGLLKYNFSIQEWELAFALSSGVWLQASPLIYDDGTGEAIFMMCMDVYDDTAQIIKYNSTDVEYIGSSLSSIVRGNLLILDDDTNDLYFIGVNGGYTSVAYKYNSSSGWTTLDLDGIEVSDGAAFTYDDGTGDGLYVTTSSYTYKYLPSGEWEEVSENIIGGLVFFTKHFDGESVDLYGASYMSEDVVKFIHPLVDSPLTADFTSSITGGEAPLSIDFTDTSIGDHEYWHWDFGDGTVSHNQNPSHIYTSEGDYTVSLTVANTAGHDSKTMVDYLTVTPDPNPVANFSATPTTGNPPFTVVFTDTSTKDPISWYWDFGDGTNSTLQNPSHEYVTGGNFSVSLEATNAFGSDLECKADFITTDRLIANFTGTPRAGPPPLTVDFTDSSTNLPTSWYWDFGDGTNSTLQNPSHEYVTGGNFSVSLEATNAYDSDLENKTEYIVVDNIVADFTATPRQGSYPLSVTFNDTSSENIPGIIYSWYWDFGDGNTSAEQNPTHTYELLGTFPVTLTVENLDGSVSDTIIKSDHVTTLDGKWTQVADKIDNFMSISSLAAYDEGNGMKIYGGMSYYGRLYSYDFDTESWVQESDRYDSYKNVISDMTVFDDGSGDAIFAGVAVSNYGGQLFKYNQTTSGSYTNWIIAADTLNHQYYINDVVNFDDGTGETIYGGNNGGGLFKYDSANGVWTSVAACTYSQYDIESLVVYDDGTGDAIYAGTAGSTSGGYLFKYVPGTGWSRITSSIGYSEDYSTKESHSKSLVVYDDGSGDTIFGGTYGYGRLYKYAPTGSIYDGWDRMAEQLNSQTIPSDLIVYNDGTGETIFGATSPNGYLYKYDSTEGGWVQVANQINGETSINRMIECYDGDRVALYGASGSSTYLYKYTHPLTDIPLTADFSCEMSEGLDGSVAVNFTDTSVGDHEYWEWDFGDGSSSYKQNPSHTYASDGDYTVSLLVANNAGHDTITSIESININPSVANFTATPTSGEILLTVNFTDTSTNHPLSWYWDFGDGFTSTLQNPSHEYTFAGNFTVSLEVTNAFGSDWENKTEYIQALPPPELTAAFSGEPTSGMYPLTVNFTDSSTGESITDWYWDFGDGNTSTSQNPSHEYVSTGDYTVKLQATNAGGSSWENKTSYISVIPPPPIAAFSGTPTSGPYPLTVSFTDDSTGESITDWYWDFGDGSHSTLQNPSHTYLTIGNYTISLTTGNLGGTDTETKTDYIYVTIYPPVTEFSGVPTAGLWPFTVTFSDESTGLEITDWYWDFGDGSHSTSQNPTHQYTFTGTFTVSLQTTNSGGSNTNTKIGYITSTDIPPVAAFRGLPTTGNNPLSVTFSDESTGLEITDWYWDFGDGSHSTSQNPTHQYTSSGVFTVSLQTINSKGGSGTETKTGYVTVYNSSNEIWGFEEEDFFHNESGLITFNATGLSDHTATLNGNSPGTDYDVYFVLGQSPDHYSYMTDWQTTSGTFNETLNGMPLFPGATYYYRAASESGAFGEEKTFVVEEMDDKMFPESTYGQYAEDFIETDGDFLEMIMIIWEPYEDMWTEVLFFGILLSMTFISIAWRQQSVIVTVTLYTLIGWPLASMFPPEFYQIGAIMCCIAVGGFIYWVFTKSR